MRSPGPKIRAEIQNAFRLPPTTTPSAMAFYHGSLLQKFDGNLFVTSAEGEHVLRIVFDAANPGTVQSTELLLRNRIGPITAIAESPDQTIYLAASTALWRIRPAN
jgi:glucose/arabinose dehydrogenase